MTAPDDFEAWMAREIAENGGVEFGADYRHWALKGYRAGHADLSGDVRELVDAAGELLTDMKIAQVNMNDAVKRDPRWEGCAAAIQPRVDRLKAALAQFHPTQRATNYVSGYVDDAGEFHPTHQEKP